jgi:hypothetical protein
MNRDQVLAWLETRRPVPPPELAARLRALVAAAPERVLAGGGLRAALADLGLSVLAGLEGRDPQEAGVALDLLAADALVTYAFEAAADEGTDVTGLAGRLLAEVSE